jgi:hypothetical protein
MLLQDSPIKCYYGVKNSDKSVKFSTDSNKERGREKMRIAARDKGIGPVVNDLANPLLPA